MFSVVRKSAYLSRDLAYGVDRRSPLFLVGWCICWCSLACAVPGSPPNKSGHWRGASVARAPSFLSYRGPGLMIQRSASPSSMYAVRARAESGRHQARRVPVPNVEPDGGLGGLREGLSSQSFSPPYPSDYVAALAAFAHQPDVVLRIAASHPHGDDVVEPYPFSLPAQDASSLISPPY